MTGSVGTPTSSEPELRSGEFGSSSVSIATTEFMNPGLIPDTSQLSSRVDELFNENHDPFGDALSSLDIDWSSTIMTGLEGDMTGQASSDIFCPVGVETSATCSEAITDTGLLDYRDYVNHTSSPVALNEIKPSSYCISKFWSPITQPVYKPLRAFLPKINANHSSPLTRALIVNTLRSYIDGFLPGNNSLPPFIHPECFSAAIPHHLLPQPKDSPPLPQPLAICSSIIQMFQAKTKENSEFIWSTVEMAQQRLAAEASSLNDWEIVTALQAIAVYFILRITENDEHNISFDIHLIQTMMVGSFSFRIWSTNSWYSSNMSMIRTLQQGPADLVASTYSTHLVAYQSGRIGPLLSRCVGIYYSFSQLVDKYINAPRTIKVLLIICTLFDITTAIPECEGNYIFDLPLSCTKKLWSAKSESEWSQEYTRCARVLGEQPPPNYQDLLLLEYGKLAAPSAKKSLLEKWLTEMDDFGMIAVITTNYVSMGMDQN